MKIIFTLLVVVLTACTSASPVVLPPAPAPKEEVLTPGCVHLSDLAELSDTLRKAERGSLTSIALTIMLEAVLEHPLCEESADSNFSKPSTRGDL